MCAHKCDQKTHPKKIKIKKTQLIFYLLGFARSFGMRLPNGERREWIKPIMFSGGLGCIEDAHVKKEQPEKGRLSYRNTKFYLYV